MPSITQSTKIKAPLAVIYDVITDFEAYPEIFPEALEAEIVKKAKKAVEVDFLFQIMTKVSCSLKFTLMPAKISWTMLRGDFMKENRGHWLLEEAGRETKVTYHIEVIPSALVPSSLIQKLISENVPKMLRNLKKRCESGRKL